MANPQHVQWLIEGVEAWNARRAQDNFRPDLSDIDFLVAFQEVDKFDESSRIPLMGANLEEANLNGVILREANLRYAILAGADLKGADLTGAILKGADLRDVNLESAILARADFTAAKLQRANLREAKLSRASFGLANLELANLSGAELAGTKFSSANLTQADFRFAALGVAKVAGADLGGANVRTVYNVAGSSNNSTPLYTDLSRIRRLTQAQLDSMNGDLGVILPAGLDYPSDWQDPAPELPERPSPKDVREIDGRLLLSAIAPPSRADLEMIHGDLLEDLAALCASGSLNNISKGFDTAFARFAIMMNCGYSDLDQVRFGVQTSALRLRLEARRDEIAEVAPEKLGDLDAVMLSAELLAARLPDWQAFVKETRDQRDAVAKNAEAVAEAIGDAEEAMNNDPEHFDPALPGRLSEYLNTKTIEAYMAAVTLLENAAFVTFREMRSFLRDTGSAARKRAVDGLALTLVTGLGSALAKLAGILPAEFDWILPWLKYIPSVLG